MLYYLKRVGGGRVYLRCELSGLRCTAAEETKTLNLIQPLDRRRWTRGCEDPCPNP